MGWATRRRGVEREARADDVDEVAVDRAEAPTARESSGCEDEESCVVPALALALVVAVSAQGSSIVSDGL